MATYSLISNGDSGLSVRTTLNQLLDDANNGVLTSGSSGTSGNSGSSGTSGNSGSSGTSGAAGANGSSGTSGSIGATGAAGSSGTSGTSGPAGATGATGPSGGGSTASIVNVGTASDQPTKYRVWSGNVAQPGSGVNNGYWIHLAAGAISSNSGQTEIVMYDEGRAYIGNTTVYVGDNSSNIGSYTQVLGRGHNNNNNPGNFLCGYASVIQSGPRECFIFSNNGVIPNTIGHAYGEMTALFGFSISAKMRGALNIPKLHIQQLPGLTNTGSSGTASGYGFKSDTDFYTNYKSFDNTNPSGATFGSVYCDENGYMKIAGKGGVPMVNYAGLSFSDDSSAAAAGVPLGGFYHTAGVVKVRTS